MTLCAFVVQWLVLYTCSECCRYYNTNDKRNLSITMLHKPFHFAWLIIFAAFLTNAIFANNHKNDICKEIVINLRRFIFTRATKSLSIFIVNRIELTKIEVTRQEWVWKNAPDFHTTSLPASLGPLSVRPRLWPHYDQAALPYLGVSCRSRIFNWWTGYHHEMVQLSYP